jgi:hypothetical protein
VDINADRLDGNQASSFATANDLSSHAGVTGAHHTKYTDTDAQNAVDGANININGNADTVNNFDIQKNGNDTNGVINFNTNNNQITIDGTRVFSSLPSQSDLFARYDPSDGATVTTSGSTVTQIDDKIGTNNLDTGTNKPDLGTLNTNDALVFDRSNSENIFGQLDSTLNTPITTGVAFRQTTQPSGGRHYLQCGNGPSRDTLIKSTYYEPNDPNDDEYSFYNGNFVLSGVQSDTSSHTLIGIYDGSNSELYLDDSLIASGDAGSRSTTEFGYGGLVPESNQRNFDGKVSQGVVYDSSLARSDVTQLHQFLNSFL